MKTYIIYWLKNFLDAKFDLRNKARSLSFKCISNIILLWSSKPVVATNKATVVFAPHQDDETLGCGGMIALKRKNKIPVNVVFIANGGQSHGQAHNATSSSLITARREEAIKALHILGIGSSAIFFLEQPDGFLHYQTIQEQQVLVNTLMELLVTLNPEEIYIPHRKDQHLDHEATYKLLKTAIKASSIRAEVLQYPIWLFWQSLLHWKLEFHYLLSACKPSISTVQDQKKHAIEAYHSQTSCQRISQSPVIDLSSGFETYYTQQSSRSGWIQKICRNIKKIEKEIGLLFVFKLTAQTPLCYNFLWIGNPTSTFEWADMTSLELIGSLNY